MRVGNVFGRVCLCVCLSVCLSVFLSWMISSKVLVFGLRYGVPCYKFLFYLQPYLFYLFFKYHPMEIIILKFSRLLLFSSRLFQKVSLKIKSFLIIFRSCWLILKDGQNFHLFWNEIFTVKIHWKSLILKRFLHLLVWESLYYNFSEKISWNYAQFPWKLHKTLPKTEDWNLHRTYTCFCLFRL